MSPKKNVHMHSYRMYVNVCKHIVLSIPGGWSTKELVLYTLYNGVLYTLSSDGRHI